MFFSFALSLIASLHPSYRLNFEVKMISISPQTDGATYEQTIERSEYDTKSKAQRLVFVRGAEKSIMTFSKTGMSIEDIHPDGSRDSKTLPIGKLPKTPEQIVNLLAGGEFKSKELGLEKTKETKTVVGIKCRKEINRVEIDGEVHETVQWVPIDEELRSRLPALESYYYQVESDSKKLTSAQIVTAVRLGPKPPKR